MHIQVFVGRRRQVTLAMAVTIGWGVFLVELAVLGWWVVRHHR
jgi:hypothetical protein